MTAPTVAPMKPAPWSSRYQPTAWPMNVARKAPAMPSAVVRMKPLGSFGPGESTRAIRPATKPIMMIQMMFHTTSFRDLRLLKLSRVERIAAIDVPRFEPRHEPAGALLRGAMGESIGHYVALRLPLQPVVADG